MADLDLLKPGKLLASASNAKQYRFMLGKGSSKLDAKALADKPDSGGADVVFQTGWLLDSSGKAEYQLSSADADEIDKKLEGAEKPELKLVILAEAPPDGSKLKGFDGGKMGVL